MFSDRLSVILVISEIVKIISENSRYSTPSCAIMKFFRFLDFVSANCGILNVEFMKLVREAPD